MRACEITVFTMRNEPFDKIMAWLQSKPALDELASAYPEVRETVRHDLAAIITRGAEREFPGYLKQLADKERFLEKQLRSSPANKNLAAGLVRQKVHTRTAQLAIRQHLVSEATGVSNGKVRFNLLNGYLAQKLLFSNALERKPVSLWLFRLLWPLVWQKRLLMPLVQPKGIYCFYSKQLIYELATLIGSKNCLEIAAGDGTLTRFLTNNGVKVTATDDYSWKSEIKYGDFVANMEAREALREHKPEVVLCSWPPAGNSFEQQVFKTRSVQMYIVIASRHRFAAGNWGDYLEQSNFEMEEVERLSRMVLPPELDATVCLFRRKQT